VNRVAIVFRTGWIVFLFLCVPVHGTDLHLNAKEYFESQGLNVLLFHNSYHEVFGDQKMGGLEIILHEQRIATNGDVRLSPTPAQWDPIPRFQERKRGPSENQLSALCTYRGFSYRVEVEPEAGGFRVAVQLDQPLPEALVGKAGFNLEFLPTAYFEKTFIVDGLPGIFPRHPDGPMRKESDGSVQPQPFAMGRGIVLSPEDPLTRVTITSDNSPLMLYDGRNQAQNGWYVVRSLIPPAETGSVVVWHVHPNVVPGWTRPAVVAYNQVGYIRPSVRRLPFWNWILYIALLRMLACSASPLTGITGKPSGATYNRGANG
jgi:endoglucanase